MEVERIVKTMVGVVFKKSLCKTKSTIVIEPTRWIFDVSEIASIYDSKNLLLKMEGSHVRKSKLGNNEFSSVNTDKLFH